MLITLHLHQDTTFFSELIVTSTLFLSIFPLVFCLCLSLVKGLSSGLMEHEDMECWSCPAVRNANPTSTELNATLLDITSPSFQDSDRVTACFIHLASCFHIKDLNHRTSSHCDQFACCCGQSFYMDGFMLLLWGRGTFKLFIVSLKSGHVLSSGICAYFKVTKKLF